MASQSFEHTAHASNDGSDPVLQFHSFRWWSIMMRESAYDPHLLAKRCCVSYRRLAMEFRRHKWGTLRTYAREQRAVQAKGWLKRLLSVKEAGARAGYRHTSQFIVEFRSVYGVTPGSFLQAFRKANEWAWSPPYRRTDRAIAMEGVRLKAKVSVP